MFHALSVVVGAVVVGHSTDGLVAHDHHECIHDKLNKDPAAKLVIERDGRQGDALASTFESIRILTVFDDSYSCTQDGKTYNCWCKNVGDTIPTFDTTVGTVQCTSADLFSTAKRQYVQTVVSDALNWIMAAFKVDRITSALKLNARNACGPGVNQGVVIPAAHKSPGLTGVDLVIYVTAVPVKTVVNGGVVDGNTAAWAVGCMDDSSTDRPVAGMVNFNPQTFKVVGTDTMNHRSNVQVTVHEIFHVLGFSTSHMVAGTHWFGGQSPLGSNGEVNTPEVQAKAREHFSCNSLSGAGIEQQGGSGTQGSHWEKRLFGNEAMTGQVTYGVTMPMSAITLAYFKDTGVYDVNYDQAGYLAWGKGKGCSFASVTDTKSCSDKSWAEYCWNDNAGQEFTQTAISNSLCNGQATPCVPLQCAFTLESMGWCDVVTYTSDLPSKFEHFADPKIGNKEELYDYCPTTVTPSANSNGGSPNGRSFGLCVDNVPAECDGLSQAACTSATSCTWDTNTCVSSLTKDFGSSYGITARCFMTNNFLASRFVPNLGSEPRCYRVTCNTAASTYTIDVSTGVTSYTPINCGSGGSTVTVSGFHGTITCWPYSEVCTGRGNVAALGGTSAPAPPGTTWSPQTPSPPAPPGTPTATAAPTQCSQRMIAQQADCLTFKDESTCLPSCKWCKIGKYSYGCLYCGEACGTLDVGTATLNYHTADQCPSVNISNTADGLLPTLSVLVLVLLCVL